MADLSIQSVGGSGSTYTTTTASSGGDAIPLKNEDTVVLIVQNNGATASSETLTLASQASKLSIGQAASDESVQVSNGGQAAVWISRDNYGEMEDADEKVQLSYTDNTAFDLAVLSQ